MTTLLLKLRAWPHAVPLDRAWLAAGLLYQQWLLLAGWPAPVPRPRTEG